VTPTSGPVRPGGPPAPQARSLAHRTEDGWGWVRFGW
jgi:hypothetical protein